MQGQMGHLHWTRSTGGPTDNRQTKLVIRVDKHLGNRHFKRVCTGPTNR